MCGITGKLHYDPQHPVERSLIERMSCAVQHRGPDEQGIWLGGPLGLGQQRLRILDLTPTGSQPMSDEAGNVWITFNGEIYNHRQLRQRLEAQGHRYRGASDTETIVHLYEELGPACVSELRGMFAFALWDIPRRRLVLARDRFGKKPLLYAETPEGLVFASEIKALLQDPQVSTEIDWTAIHHYLTYGYVPAPLTAFKSIRKLPPASLLVWEAGQMRIERYWRLAYTPKLEIGEAEAAEEVLRLLREATRLRLMSDVPLGAFLSGGIDSSAVVALMAEASGTPVKTFSIGFDDRTYDELPFARQVAQRFGTDHHEFRVTPDALRVLPELVWAYGEPFADSSALPSYYVAKMTRQFVTVALNGDGGDEDFAGYERYLADRLGRSYLRLPPGLRKGVLAPLARRLPEGSNRTDPLRRLKRFALAMDAPPAERYARWITLLSNSEKIRLYTPAFRQKMAGIDSLDYLATTFAAAGSPDPLDQALSADIETYLPGNLLVKMDIASMTCSLEARSPFLDHVLAEFAARLPAGYKLRGRTSKYILKKALRGLLPDNILDRPKAGFAVPVARWFRNELRSTAYEVLLDRRALQRGIFDSQAVRAMLDEHSRGQVNHRTHLWELLWLELWFRAYIDRSRSELTGPAEGIL